MTHLLLIWKKIQLAAGHGRYVLEKKLSSLSTLIRCTHAVEELQLFLDFTLCLPFPFCLDSRYNVVHFSCVVVFTYCHCSLFIHYHNLLLYAQLGVNSLLSAEVYSQPGKRLESFFGHFSQSSCFVMQLSFLVSRIFKMSVARRGKLPYVSLSSCTFIPLQT